MSTLNEPDKPEHLASAGPLERAESAEGGDAAGVTETAAASADEAGTAPAPKAVDREQSDTPADQQPDISDEAPRDAGDSATVPVGPAETSIYVRRGRTPTLGFWVAVAIALPAVIALISAPFFDFADLGGVANFVLLAAVVVGLPLATIAAVIDSVRHRQKRAPRR